MNSRYIRFAFVIVALSSPLAMAGIPAPDTVLFGRLQLEGELIGPGRNVTLIARLQGTTDVIADFSYGKLSLTDCNLNAFRDTCELDCSADGGECNIPGCGQGVDLDDNGVLDVCHRYTLRLRLDHDIPGEPRIANTALVGDTVEIVALDADNATCVGGDNAGDNCLADGNCINGSCEPAESVLTTYIIAEAGRVSKLNLGGVCTIVGSSPFGCLVDAGQPHPPTDESQVVGTSSVQVVFGCPVGTLPDVDFDVTVQSGDAPGIISAIPVGAFVVLNLDNPIPAGQWTCFTHGSSLSQVCLGSMPGDVNGNGTSDELDVLAMIDGLNGTVPYSTETLDIDRDGVVAPEDLLRTIDLMNGAATFDPYFGQSLGDCPTSN